MIIFVRFLSDFCQQQFIVIQQLQHLYHHHVNTKTKHANSPLPTYTYLLTAFICLLLISMVKYKKKCSTGARQGAKPKTGAERMKKYRQNLLKRAQSGDRRISREAKLLIQRQKDRIKANKQVTNTSQHNAYMVETPGMEWINKISSFAAKKELMSRVRHALPPPVFVSGNAVPVPANVNDRDVMFLDDIGTWRAWFHMKKSEISGAGQGLFAARSFQSGSILTKYIGKTTKSCATKRKWLRDREKQHYVLELNVNGKPLWIIPLGSGMYSHILNYKTKPNCEFDMKTGIVTAIYDIKKNEELTLNYGKDYVKTWES